MKSSNKKNKYCREKEAEKQERVCQKGLPKVIK